MRYGHFEHFIYKPSRKRACTGTRRVSPAVRYLVISDIHANLEALEAVTAATAGARIDRVLVLGDLVGYGPDPNAVVDHVRALTNAAIIRGNHDKVAAGLERSDRFNPVARTAVEWTAHALSPRTHAYLAELAQGPVGIDDLVEICHGTPFDEDVYVFDELDAQRALRAANRRVCLFGHTHVAVGFCTDGTGVRVTVPRQDAPLTIDIGAGDRWLVNCGAVGQPRDGDWRAAYGIVDTTTDTLTLNRVEYDVARTQAKITAAGLPEILAHRLGLGR